MVKKWLKFIITVGMVLSWLCLCHGYAYANSMQSLDFHVELKPNGSGIVTETRKMNLSEDTEIYIKMENLGGSQISDFKVSDYGKPLTYQPNWNIKASQSEKSGKYGIVSTNNGSELCWGIGKYGEHEYIVTYTISGMVRQLKDGQALNWKLFDGDGNINPAAMSITIDGPKPFTPENTKIWGFGFEGAIHLENGKLVGKSVKSLSDSNYVTILMQFTDSPFQPIFSLDKTLIEQENLAKEGSSYKQEDGSVSIVHILIGIAVAAVFPVLFILAAIILVMQKRAVQKAHPLMQAKERRKLNKDKYYREIPYTDGPMTDVAYMLEQVDRGSIENYFNAFLLNWLKEGSIDHITEEKGFIFKTNKSVIQLNRAQIEGSDLESRLWNMMQSAAGQDNKLEEKEFSKWAKTNYTEIDDLKNDLSNGSKSTMMQKGYLDQKEVTVLKYFSNTIVSSTDQGENLLNHLVQFENYLMDFSLLNERGAKEVILWDNLLIWSSLFGIAEEVAKQFEKLYPQYMEESQFTDADFYVMTHFTNSFASGYHSGQSSAGSGGGGFTSSGGGGGSFGGGGGGSR